FAVALAALLAFVLSRVFLLPLKRVTAATHRLAAGNYATRVEVRSSDELGRLSEDFNRLAQALERNETLRRRFMADVSHELRTPLAVLSAGCASISRIPRPACRARRCRSFSSVSIASTPRALAPTAARVSGSPSAAASPKRTRAKSTPRPRRSAACASHSPSRQRNEA